MSHEHETHQEPTDHSINPSAETSRPAGDGSAATTHTESAQPTGRLLTKPLIILLAILVVVIAALWYGRSLLIAATVDGQPISRLALIRELEQRAGADALDAKITEQIIINEAARRNILISADVIDAEIKLIEDQLAEQNLTLDSALAMQGLSRSDLVRQISIQKNVEALLADKVTVTDEEVETYITEQELTLTEGQEEAERLQIRDMLKNQKMSAEVPALVDELRAKAEINYFGPYIRQESVQTE